MQFSHYLETIHFFQIAEKTHECLNLGSVTVINLSLSFNAWIFFCLIFFYHYKNKINRSPQTFPWAEVGMPAGWVGGGRLAGLLGHPTKGA